MMNKTVTKAISRYSKEEGLNKCYDHNLLYHGLFNSSLESAH